MSNRYAGDTLIEVLFAFAILSLVISVMFSGALSSYKSSLSAQDRTTALFVAQYQADGLKTYRDSLSWSGPGFSFLDGDTVNVPAKLTALRTITDPFCMSLSDRVSTPPSYWEVKTNLAVDCNGATGIAKTLAPGLDSPQINIYPQSLSADGNQRLFKVEVSWKARNSGQREKVENTILLTSQR